MFDLNRIVIFLLLAALLYALYKYQQQINGISKVQSIHRRKRRLPRENRNINHDVKAQPLPRQSREYKNRQEENNDTISVGNVSQLSLGSLLDVDGVDKEEIYKPASVLNSLESGNTMSLMDGNSEDSFFFQ